MVSSARESILELKDQMPHDIIGQEHIVERLIIGLLANGNLLVEGLPGWPRRGRCRAWRSTWRPTTRASSSLDRAR